MIMPNPVRPNPNRNRHGSPPPRFCLGQIVLTPGAIHAFCQAQQQPIDFLIRHVSGDWGELGDEDKRANDAACRCEGDPERRERILSAYRTAKGEKLWVITESDRSVTTFLLPSEY
jgi:hypothetical protein